MQNLFPKNNESEIGIKMGNSKRMIKSVIRESDLSRASQSHEKEMSDLEKMGVLKWSDSEARYYYNNKNLVMLKTNL